MFAGLAMQAQHQAMPASDSANNDKVFNSLADQYFDKYYFKFNPSAGTAAGFHQYDTQLEGYSKASLDQQVTTLKNFQKVIGKIDPLQLSTATRVDHTLVLDDINARLLSLESIRPWEKNPDVYSSGVTNSIFLIMARTFAPPAERLKSLNRAAKASVKPKLCYDAGSPGTPDTVIPGSPGTPDTVIPGVNGAPDTVIPGTPRTPDTVIPGIPGLRAARIRVRKSGKYRGSPRAFSPQIRRSQLLARARRDDFNVDR